MDLNQIPLFAMLKGKLSYNSQRQRVIAGNVANADVPNYAPRDLKPFTFTQAMQQTQGVASTSVVAPMIKTSSAHMELADAPTPAAESANAPDSEVRLDGNRVVLEEQMVKMSEARMDYDAVVGFYQQSLNMLRTAIKKPGE